MRTVKSFILYIFVLLLELFRLFSLLYIEKLSTIFGSLLDFTGFAVLCIPAVIIFLIINNEKEFYKFFKLVSFVKVFSIGGSYLYFTSIIAVALSGIAGLSLTKLITYIILPCIMFIIDVFVLVFSLLKGNSLCKLYQ